MPSSRRTQKVLYAQALRGRMTAAETLLWEQLRDRQLGGFKFKRQMPIGVFIADFCCPRQKLIIEVDGEIHRERQEHDASRTLYLQERGFRVLRIPNYEVQNSMKRALNRILYELYALRVSPEA